MPPHAYIQAEAMVTLVFNAGAEALDIEGTATRRVSRTSNLAITLYCSRRHNVCARQQSFLKVNLNTGVGCKR